MTTTDAPAAPAFTALVVIEPPTLTWSRDPSKLAAAGRHIGKTGITSNDHAVVCVKLRDFIKALIDEIENGFAPSVDAAHKAHKSIVAMRNALTDELEEADRFVKTQLDTWTAAQVAAGLPAPPGLLAVNGVDWKCVDMAAVPREYLMLDEKKIGALVKVEGVDTNIPGIEVFASVTARKKPGRPRKGPPS